ncbi:MAG: cytochrome c [Pirellulales bacterium]|nr:cytochrome c [Pirellulales bacterium]
MAENAKPSSIPRSFLFALMLTLMALFIAASAVFAQPLAQAPDGATLFKEKCAVCHTIGGGDLLGPDLQGVTERRDPAWLKQWILVPDQVLASGDPIATELLAKYKNVPMPNLALTPDQVAALLAYMSSGATAGGATAGGATAALPAGDAAVGKAYFLGNQRFENGGPQCMSCHSVAGLGSLGGGNLGPDLTTSGFVQSDAAFTSFMAAPSTQTMGAIWATTPLTPQEQADLYAFLSQASVAQREPSALLQIALLAIIGAVAMIALAQFHWGKRLKGVRKPMIEGTYAAAKK